jgi:hypothetical protein
LLTIAIRNGDGRDATSKPTVACGAEREVAVPIVPG